MPKKENEIKIVSWFLPKKALIKFEGEDETISLSSKVLEVSNFEKYPILKGDTVEVGIANDEVAFLRKISGQKKVTKKEESNDSENVVKTLTIEAIFNNESVKFKEEKINGKKWCPLSDELKSQDIKSLGLVAKNKVEVTISNGKIIAVNTFETNEEQKSNTSKEEKSSYYSDKGNSIEKQCALKSAVEIITSYIDSKAGFVDTIEKTQVLIKQLTKVCYDAIQSV